MTILRAMVMIAPLLLTSCASNQTTLMQAEKDYAAGNYGQAFKKLWTPAKYNNPQALYAMGYMYYYGLGTDKDQDLGRSLIRRSAKLKYPPAVVALNLILQNKHDQYVPFNDPDTKHHENT